MANIVLTGVYRTMQSRFNTEGAGLVRFEEDFITAAKMACARINRDADLETRITIGNIADTDDEVALSDEYLDIFSDVVAFNLMYLGQRPARGDEASMPTEDEISKKVNAIRRDIQAQAQEADTDDTSDFVALGGLG